MEHVIENRTKYFFISGFLILVSLIALFALPLDLGIDMTWGTQSEFRYADSDLSLDTVEQIAQEEKDLFNAQDNIINTVNVYKITGENTFVVESGFVWNDDVTALERDKIAFRDSLENRFTELSDITLERYTNIGASFWDYIRNTAKITLVIAIIAIALYIAYAFSWSVSGVSSLSFAFVTIITLFHDVFISTGLYIMVSSIFHEFQIDTFFVTALLTILGYSINDTIVIFDRIRSNLKQYGGKGKDLKEIVDMSINESLTRSIYTSLTLVFVLLCLLVFWPESISGFTLAMLFGTIVGTYSSIFIASPLLYQINKNKTLKEYKKEEINPDDKIVV